VNNILFARSFWIYRETQENTKDHPPPSFDGAQDRPSSPACGGSRRGNFVFLYVGSMDPYRRIGFVVQPLRLANFPRAEPS
jgi:hypothetical protein